MLQAQSFSLIEALQALWQGFVVVGAILGLIAFIITFLKFYLDYFKGSDIKFLETKELFYTVPLEVERHGEFSHVIAEIPISLIFTNEGNKTGIIDDIWLEEKSTEGIAHEARGVKELQKMLPLTIKGRDSNHFSYTLVWYLTNETAKKCEKGPITLETTRKLQWRRTVHTGRLKNKIELDTQKCEVKIKVEIYYG